MLKRFAFKSGLVWNAFTVAFVTLVLAISGARADKEIVIAAFGDSLSAGYRLEQSDAFPVQLEKALQAKGHQVRVLNTAVSGDTTSAGLARLDWSISDDVDAVIVELGANDALRGVDPAHTKATLDKIVTAFKNKNVKVLLTGMEASRALGDEYVNSFRALFQDVAEKHGTLFYPFFLEGIALKPEYNLDDGMHPNAKGVGIIVENILPSVEQLIERVKADT